MTARTRIQIVGADGAKSRLLAERTAAVGRELGLDFEIEHVVDASEISDSSLVASPALAVDGLIVASGRVPSVAELRELLRPISSSVA